MVRRNKTGHITQQRQGCSATCEPEDCKHLTRHCCNASHCNVFPDDKPTDLPAVATAGSSGSFSSRPLPSPQVSPSSEELSSSGEKKHLCDIPRVALTIGRTEAFLGRAGQRYINTKAISFMSPCRMKKPICSLSFCPSHHRLFRSFSCCYR